MKIFNLNKTGYSMVELIIAIALSVIISSAAYYMYLTQSKHSQVQHEISAMEQELVAAMNIIEVDVRNAGLNREPEKGYFTAFLLLPVTTIGIQYDTVGIADGQTLSIAERIKYTRNSENQLLRCESNSLGITFKANSILANNISTFGLTYTTGTFTDQPLNNIRTLTVQLTKTGNKNDPDTGEPITRTVSRTINVRNYGLNK